MSNWEELKSNIRSLSDQDKKVNDITASLIAETIKRRNSLNLTQRDLSEMTGLKQAAIARYESLNAIPRIDTFIRIITALGLRCQLIPENEKIID